MTQQRDEHYGWSYDLCWRKKNKLDSILHTTSIYVPLSIYMFYVPLLFPILNLPRCAKKLSWHLKLCPATCLGTARSGKRTSVRGSNSSPSSLMKYLRVNLASWLCKSPYTFSQNKLDELYIGVHNLRQNADTFKEKEPSDLCIEIYWAPHSSAS